MAEQKKAKVRGAKTQKSEVVTVRLEPKLRYMTEIAARVQRRTLSSLIEQAVEESLKSIVIWTDDQGKTESVADLSNKLWDPIESDRFCILASTFPNLLTHDEQKLDKLITELQRVDPLVSDYHGEMKGFRVPIEQLERVRKHWLYLNEAAQAGELPSTVAKHIKEIDAKP